MATKARGTSTSRKRGNSKAAAPRQRRPSTPAVRAEGALFAPDSPVVTTAQELAAAHLTDRDGFCPRCHQPTPCPTARHALEVCRAAGL